MFESLKNDVEKCLQIESESSLLPPTIPQKASNRFATVAISIIFVAVEDASLKSYFYYSTALAIDFFSARINFSPLLLNNFFPHNYNFNTVDHKIEFHIY
jgi:hypothetical protein